MIDDDRGAPTESDALELSRAIEDWAFESEGLKDAREFLIRTAAGGKDARCVGCDGWIEDVRCALAPS